MYVVPLERDTITTAEGATFTVASFTNYKTKGPACYATTPGLVSTDATPIVYFFDIVKINDVHVEFDNSSKTFKASGKIKRKYHLPQPGDKIHLLKPDTPLDQENDIVKVEKLKLHNKSEGIAKGLLICDDKGCHPLSEIIAIDRTIGSDSFDRKKFLRLYKEYAGISK